jgi:hypothetical protein
MLAPPPKPSNTIISGSAAKGRAPDESIRLLVAEVIRICEEMEADIRNDVHRSDAETEKLSARLVRLEKKIAKSRAATVEELKAKAQAVNRLSEFAIESIITDSIIRDLVMSDSSCARADQLSAA